MSLQQLEIKRTLLLDANKEANECRAIYTRVLRKTFHEEAARLFKDFPELNSFSWNQYTDKELEEFYVDRLSLLINGSKAGDFGMRHVFYQVSKDVFEFLDLFDDEDLNALFGDYVTVTVYSTDVQVGYCQLPLTKD